MAKNTDWMSNLESEAKSHDIEQVKTSSAFQIAKADSVQEQLKAELSAPVEAPKTNRRTGNPNIAENAKKYGLGRKKGTRFSPPSGYVDADELAKVLGYSATHIKKLAREGKIASEQYVRTIFHIDNVIRPKFGESIAEACHAIRIAEGKPC